MGGAELDLRNMVAQEVCLLFDIGDARTDIEALAAAIMLAQQRLADDDGIEGRDIGADRQPVERRGGDERQFAHARQSQLQGARDRRRGERQHMHIGAQFLQSLLVLDAEMLLFIDDQKAQIAELDAFGEERVGADHDVDLALGEPSLHGFDLLAPDKARGLRQAKRQALEALQEGRIVLARQQSRRHHHGHLLAVHRRDESGSQRHFGLAEADIAANEPVHRAALLQVFERRLDGGELVLRLLIGEARTEFVIEPFGRRQDLARFEFARRRSLDQVLGDLADTLLELRLLRLPGAAAQTVELGALFVGPVARQELDILDGQEQTVVARIHDEEAVMRCCLHLDGTETLEAAEPMIDMDDEIARCER